MKLEIKFIEEEKVKEVDVYFILFILTLITMFVYGTIITYNINSDYTFFIGFLLTVGVTFIILILASILSRIRIKKLEGKNG